MEFRIESYEAITSTNDRIKRAIDAGEPEGLAARALVQTAGYGRQGRTWQSPLGGMYQSFLLRPDVPPAQLPTLSLLVGLAVRRAVIELVPALSDRVQVKWPNDLVVATVQGGKADTVETVEAAKAAEGSASPAVVSPVAAAPSAAEVRPKPFLKLGGISLEAHRGAVCVGIGVNVSRPVDVPQASGKNVPVFLDELGLCGGCVEDRIESVANAICDQVSSVYLQWCDCGFAPFVDEFNSCSALAGRAVRMEDIEGNMLTAGVVQHVCADGRLALRTADAQEVLVGSGEAHIRA